MLIIILNLLTLCINIILAVLIANRFGTLEALKEEYISLKNDFNELLYENTYLSKQYLDELEEKISEGERLLEDLMEQERKIKKESNLGEDNDEETYNPVSVEIARMLKQGKSITEIAEKLNTTKGEVVLRLNLGEKLMEKK
ncbi:MAG: response regulator transcription factor [Clostridia bacterium]|nr:response regulator transcription factor [Clostridia bacterium]